MTAEGNMGVEQLELRVSGMSCGACERRIETALGRLDGVLRSSADHRVNQVRVAFDPRRVSEPSLRSCIEQAGYEVGP